MGLKNLKFCFVSKFMAVGILGAIMIVCGGFFINKCSNVVYAAGLLEDENDPTVLTYAKVKKLAKDSRYYHDGVFYVPQGIKCIASLTFEGFDCKEIILPEGLEKIDVSGFYGCVNLERITIPSSVTFIGNGAFSSCESLSEVKFLCELSSLPPMIFTHCAFSEFAIPNGVKNIDNCAFAKCENLTKILIPNSVNSIGEMVFFGCKKLTNISIPNSVNSIRDIAFWGCKELTNISIPNSVSSIGNSAFECCNGLSNISIPVSVASIGKYAFKDCKNLITVNIVPGKKDNTSESGIDDPRVFEGCTSLRYIYIHVPGVLLNI